jgi:hypothetical protein
VATAGQLVGAIAKSLAKFDELELRAFNFFLRRTRSPDVVERLEFFHDWEVTGTTSRTSSQETIH